MRRMLVTMAAVMIVLAGCSSSDGSDGSATTEGATTTTAAAAITTTPRPSAGQEASLDAEIRAIYEGLPDGKAVDWAVAVCSDILRGVEGSELEGNVIIRFSGGDRPDPTPEQASAIIAVVRSNGFCTGA